MMPLCCCLPVCLQRDASVFELLQDACWPVKQEAAFSALMDMGADAVDALAVAAHSSCASSMFLGLTYHAHVALHYVVGQLSAMQLRQLLQECLDNENASQGRAPEAAAAAADTAHNDLTSAEGGASELDSSSRAGSSGKQASAAAAAASPAGAASRSEVEASLEGALLLVRGHAVHAHRTAAPCLCASRQQQAGAQHALSGRKDMSTMLSPLTAKSNERLLYSLLAMLRCYLQAQALHPLSDVSALRRLVRQLGQELARRMDQAQVLPGSRQVRDE
jgi:hypothetical protein